LKGGESLTDAGRFNSFAPAAFDNAWQQFALAL
jgi:hypothetical protein